MFCDVQRKIQMNPTAPPLSRLQEKGKECWTKRNLNVCVHGNGLCMNIWEPVLRVLLIICSWVQKSSANIEVEQEMVLRRLSRKRRNSSKMVILWHILYFLHVIKTYTPSGHAFTGNRTHDLGISVSCLSYRKCWACRNSHLDTNSFKFYPHVFYYICYVKIYSKSLWNASFLPNSGSYSAVFFMQVISLEKESCLLIVAGM